MPRSRHLKSRDALVGAVLGEADDLVVVGSAEPVGLTRLARLLVDMRQLRPPGPTRVVVNRMRAGLGWREAEIVDMVARLTPSQVHFLPFDLDGADRAMQAGRSPVELGGSPLGAGMVDLSSGLVAGEPARARRLVSRRSDGAVAPVAQTVSSSESPPTVYPTITRRSGSCAVSWCRRGSTRIARSWAAMTPST